MNNKELAGIQIPKAKNQSDVRKKESYLGWQKCRKGKGK